MEETTAESGTPTHLPINEENARRMGQGVAAMRSVMLARAEAVGRQVEQMCESMRPALTEVGRKALGK